LSQKRSGDSIVLIAALSGTAAILFVAVLIIIAFILFQRRNKKKAIKEVEMVGAISRENSLGKGEIQMQELKNIQVKELLGSGIVHSTYYLISNVFLVGNFGEVYKGRILEND
jgi:hypothetical protein